ncbi:hypothetical protein N8985_04615 [Glaciecola sp.]|jgi:hypothetical protein|nr:hypothetical protein [Glaciecola sp.]
MNKPLKLVLTLAAFVAIASLVYLAGYLSLSTNPLIALLPVAIILVGIVFYIHINENN